MATNVLVVTSSPSFGENMRRFLEDAGTYNAFIVNNKASAVVRADEESCSAAFLDMNLGAQWVEDIGRSLRTVLPEIKLFVLAEDEAPPALDSIRPWTLVSKPFQSPELIKAIERPVSRPVISSASPSASGEMDLPWLNDVTKAAQHLTRLSLGSASQAALITRGGMLWAYAGQLSQSAANEVSRTLAHNWSGQKGSDLLRFVRLESTKAEHMLYATQLAEGVLFAMVFDAETPFSTIRSQASDLVTSLSEDEKNQQQILPATAPLSSEILEDQDEGIEIPPISEIIHDIPSPDPVRSPQAPKPVLSTSAEASSDVNTRWPRRTENIPEIDQTHRSIFSRESSPPIPIRASLVKQQPEDREQTFSSQVKSLEELEVTAPSKSRPRPETPVRQPAPGELDVTRPHSANELSEQVTLEPISAGLYHLTYACLLVPRFTSHYLTGDIADRLSEWLPSICVAFGWRLEYLAVRPEYLQWVVNVPPSTSPGYLMRVLRQQTSEKIFAELARVKKDNPSGDFWAPGYLIMGGSQPHPPQLVKDYIKQIRQRQGLEKPRK